MNQKNYRIREITANGSRCIKHCDTLHQVGITIDSLLKSDNARYYVDLFGSYVLSVELYNIKYCQWVSLYELITSDNKSWEIQ